MRTSCPVAFGVVDFDGNSGAKFMLAEIDNIETGRENYVYTIQEDPEQGDTVRKYEVKI